MDLSDNYQNQAQKNAVVPSQKEMDRVGVEPTTSAFSNSALYYLLSKEQQSKETLLFKSHPLQTLFLCMLLAYIIRQAKF
jgi:hypothetical protein